MMRSKDDITESIQRVCFRSLAMCAAGAGLGFTWGILRGAAFARTYSVFLSANMTLASLPCFTIREIIGPTLPDAPASALSGAIGGSIVAGAYAGMKSVPKGAALFSVAGLVMQQGSEQYYAWKLRKREEILKERSREA